jgi:cell pole-organizing protein PopZ
MRPWFAAAIAAAFAFAAVAPSSAQSLAEVAARTKKKQEEDKAAKPPAKVYTESDLHGRPGSGSMSQMDGPVAVAASPSPAPGAAAAGAATPAGAKPKTEDEERAEQQTEWRDRLQKAEADVTRISEEIERAQTALNDISGPLYGGTRAGLITRVEEGKRQLATAQQTVVDIQEEGRRARYR